MNGYTQEQTKELIKMAMQAKKDGASLTDVFREYSDRYGRAQGSVRNYYYFILKSAEHGDGYYSELLKNSNLTATESVKFTASEERQLLTDVLTGISKGKSVRKAIHELSGGDGVKALRIQNKYRNLLNAKPELVEEVKSKLKSDGVNVFSDGKNKVDNTFLYKNLCKEINGLVDRLQGNYKAENERLKRKISMLESENKRLKEIVFSPLDSKVKKYYGDVSNVKVNV